jgi:cyanophycinase-like exopeptidase
MLQIRIYFITFLLFTLSSRLGYSQIYTSYFTGNLNDTVTFPSGGSCLMGGATEDDEAMKWFLNQADGGDILVLRASGSDGYNTYFYSDLGVSINSVETIVFNQAGANSNSYIHQKIEQAEAIWFAGGDQWDYVSYWRNTKIDSLINRGIQERNLVVGGTSAGMAILGEYYFSAQNGTVTSATALANPYASSVKVDSTQFLKVNYLSKTITDTHYDDPDRKGRHIVFLARILTDYGIEGRGIACDEYTAVCIDSSGIARVFGTYPDYDDNAYFIQTNCELSNPSPENCTPGSALNWDLNQQAVRVYQTKGTSTGAQTFDLNDWKTGTGGVWESWYVSNGQLSEQASSPIDCTASNIDLTPSQVPFTVFPNPSSGQIYLYSPIYFNHPLTIRILDLQGREIQQLKFESLQEGKTFLQELNEGIYFFDFQSINYRYKTKFVIH